MSELTLLLSLLIAAIVPRMALRYLQPILMQVLHRMCEITSPPPADLSADSLKATNSGPEFWWRVLNVLAISGSVLLVLTFGYNDGYMVTLNDFLRRTLWLVTMGVFLSVSVVALQIWSRITPAPAETRRALGRNGQASSVVVPSVHAGTRHGGTPLAATTDTPAASDTTAAPAGGPQGAAS